MFSRRLCVISVAFVLAAVPLFGGVTKDGNTVVVTATPSTTVAWLLLESTAAQRTSGLSSDTDGDGVIRIDYPGIGRSSVWVGIDLTSGELMQMRLYFDSPMYDAPVPFPQKISTRRDGRLLPLFADVRYACRVARPPGNGRLVFS
jgi:hypothetical protein